MSPFRWPILFASVVALAGAALFASPWALATPAQCNVETERELKMMQRAGFEGDPPITLGFITGSVSVAISFSPCGFTDGLGRFRPKVSIFTGSKTCLITERQYDSLYRTVGPNTRELSWARVERLARKCSHGKLPALPETADSSRQDVTKP